MIKLIVAADEPALFYSSLEAAAANMEAVDVEDGVYTAAYGPQGQSYRITAEAGRVVITSNPHSIEPEALRALILRFLAGVRVQASGAEDLATLVARCEPFLMR